MTARFNFDITEERELELWRVYKRGDDEGLREYFIRKYGPLVKYVAGKIACHVPDNVEFDDLVGYGTFGLLDAIEKFDPEKGNKFKTYGITRIRGQIYDELRSMDWVPRSVRQKFKVIEEEKRKYDQIHDRKITLKELAEATGYSEREIEEIDNLNNDSLITSLDDIWMLGNDDDKISVLDTVQSPEEENPDYKVEKTEVRATIAEEIKKLPEKEKQVLILYYYEDLTLKEIGAVLEVTESRVSQLHTKAIRQLRNSLELIKKSLI